MNGIGQLFKGVLIGLVLLLAVIGLLKLSGKAGNPEVATPTQTDIPAPSISVNNPSSTNTDTTSTTPSTTASTHPTTSDSTASSATKETTLDKVAQNTEDDTDKIVTQNAFKPEILEEPVSYGTLNLTAKQKVEFLIFNENNKRVAASKNNSKASFHLPTGTYKVITLLGQQKETQTIVVEKNKISNTTVSIQVPITTGVLKLAAISAKSKQSIKTTFSIEDANGKLVGKRQNVSSTLFKLDAGTYKVTATHNDMSEIQTLIVEAGSSSQQIFSLKRKQTEPVVEDQPPVVTPVIASTQAPTKQQPPVIKEAIKETVDVVEAVTPETDKVQEIIDTVKTVAPPLVTTPAITIKPDTEIKTAVIDNPKNVPVIPVEQPPTIPEITADVIKQGTLKLSAVSANTQKPVKSNFYVQTTNGKHIAKKIYTNSASFNLDKGTYRITIKSKNMTTVTKTVTVNADRKLNQIFSMHGTVTAKIPEITPVTTPAVIPAVTRDNQSTRPVPSRNTQANTKPKPRALPASGSLVFNIRHSRNRLSAPNALLSNFVIKTKSGKKIANINKVQHATVKLDVGEYVITANHKGRRKSRSFKISNNRATNVSFKSSDFSAFKPQAPVKIKRGVLRSRVVDQRGRAVKGNISVTDLRGKLLHRVNNVSTAQFHLPAKPYMVHINYNGLKGSERVKIISGETTVQTFTIADAPAPQTRRPQSRPQQQQQQRPQQQPNRSRNTQPETMSGRDLRHAIGDKFKEEFKRITR